MIDMGGTVLMHIRNEIGEWNHVVCGIRNKQKMGFVKVGEELFYLDPKFMEWGSWPTIIPGVKRPVQEIRFHSGNIGPINIKGKITNATLPVEDLPTGEDDKVRTTWALDQLIKNDRIQKVFGSQRMNPLVIITIISILTNLGLGAMAFMR